MSAFPPLATRQRISPKVRFVPTSDIRTEKGRQLRRPYRMPSCVIARAESCAASWTPVCAILMIFFAIISVRGRRDPGRRGCTTSSDGGCVAGSISDFADPVELLSCAGSRTCTGSCTCAPHLTPLCARCAPRLTPLCARHAPRLTPPHASGWSRSGRSRSGLSLSIGYCQYSRGRREAERSRQSHQ